METRMSAKIISPAEFRRLMDGGRPLNILDVRTRPEFTRVHAVGARSMPLDELDPTAVAAQQRDCNDAIYVICQSGGRSAKACERLQQAGLSEVYSIEGGTAAWERMGLPVERGRTNVISLERQVRIVAGGLVLLGTVLAWGIHPGFLAIPAFVGAGLLFAGITDYCGMGGFLSRMPWNRARP
jgi:rhodanese-related sulfurtransferase